MVNSSTDIWKAVLEYNTKKLDGRSYAKCVELFHLSTDPSESQDLLEDSVWRTTLELNFREMTSGKRTVKKQ